jgi:hypothetical protein
MDREFLNPASPAVERYANGVLDLIKRKARAVHEERERERIERLRSRGERV